MNFIHDYTATEKGITDQTHAIHYDWSDLETAEVFLSRRLFLFGLRLAPYIVFEFSQSRRFALRPRSSPITGKPRLSSIAKCLKHGLAAAPIAARFSERALLWARYGALGPAEERRIRQAVLANLSLPELLEAAAFYQASVNYKAAERTLRFARKIDPYHLDVRKMTATLAIEKGKPSSITLALLHNVLSQDPNQADAREARALICLINDLASGEAEAKAILAERPSCREVAFAYADYLVRNARAEESLTVLRALQAHSGASNTKDAADAEIRKIESTLIGRRPALNRWKRRGRSALVASSVVLGILVMLTAAIGRTQALGRKFSVENALRAMPAPKFKSLSTFNYGSSAVAPAKSDPQNYLETNALDFSSTANIPSWLVIAPPLGGSAQAEKRLSEALALLQKKSSANEFAQARDLLNSAAQAGNAKAMTYLGIMYEQALGGPRDVALAEEWWRKSAARSDPAALFFLGEYFLRQRNEGHISAEVGEIDIEIWLRSAAADGFPLARAALARLKAPPIEKVPSGGGSINPVDQKALAQTPAGDRQPVPITQSLAEYPPSLRYLGIEGEVVVGFVVNASGDVEDPAVVSSSVEQFEKPALASVLRWHFQPALKAGRQKKKKCRFRWYLAWQIER